MHVDVMKSLAMIKINDQFLVEENIFVETQYLPWVKAAITLVFVVTLICGGILLGISIYERLGYLGPYRTLINQLVASMNIMVS